LAFIQRLKVGQSLLFLANTHQQKFGKALEMKCRKTGNLKIIFCFLSNDELEVKFKEPVRFTDPTGSTNQNSNNHYFTTTDLICVLPAVSMLNKYNPALRLEALNSIIFEFPWILYTSCPMWL
jgi:hypothetical protein